MKNNNFILIFFIITLLFVSFFIPLYLVEILGFSLILYFTLKKGWKKGLIVAILTSAILFIDHFYLHTTRISTILISIILLYFAIPLFAGRYVEIIKEKNDELRNTRKELKEKNQLLESILEKAPIGIWVVDEEQNPILVNKYFKENTGFGTDNVSMTEKELKRCKETDNKTLNSNETERFEEKVTFKDGKKHVLQTVKTKIEYNQHNVLGVLGIGVDITERKEKEKEIKRISFHDHLTGLYNRRYFENELNRLNNSRKIPITIIVADMDGLKQINDNYGHQMGDKFIKNAGDILDNTLRTEDIVARTGGDEFAILLPETDQNSAKDLIKRIKNEFACFNQDNNLPETLKISLGYSTKNSNSKDLNEVFDIADKKMYKKKSKKK